MDAPKPGIYEGVPFEEYERWDAINASAMKGICAGECARHFHADRRRPASADDTVAKAFGRVGHVALLEPAAIDERFAVRPPSYPVLEKVGHWKGSVKPDPEGDGSSFIIAEGLGEKRTTRKLASTYHEDADIYTAPLADLRDKVKLIERPWNANATFCRTWTAAMQKRGLTPISAGAREQALAVADSARRHPHVAELLDGAALEVSFVWTDPGSGLLCKGRADILNRQRGVGDPKTTRHRLPYRFARQGYYLGYHVQVAMYTDGLSILLDGWDPKRKPIPFWLIAIEKEPPYLTKVFDGHAGYLEADETSLPTAYLELGRQAYRGQLQHIAWCINNDEWPDYGDEVQEMVIPRGAGLEM